jgi:hypothetical protein
MTQSLSRQYSDKLSRGEVSGAEEALRYLVYGMEAEMEEERRWNASLGSDEQQYRWENGSAMQQYRDTAQQALDIWQEEMEAAKARVIERLRALHTSEHTQIADALEAEAWDALAW